MSLNKAAKRALAIAQQERWTEEYNALVARGMESLSARELVTHGAIGGVLDVCSYPDTGDAAPEFAWQVCAKVSSLDETLQQFYGKHNFSTISKTLIEQQEKELREKLNEWLLQFTGLHQFIPLDLIYQLIERMFDLAKPTRVWKIELQPIGWYAASWDDFAFESDNLVFILHLGCSD